MADAYIVDTGVFLRWFVDQPGYEHAREMQDAFLRGQVMLETADFARIEVAGVLRKKGLLSGRLIACMTQSSPNWPSIEAFPFSPPT
ncbi:hypothetical protein [Nonomuraea sp. NPDC050786]|uniref:hypothetical protein n=1 Tax=Nonomuraea sp. NPDC050786 TaxID=3154840 RepID=UPI0033E16562